MKYITGIGSRQSPKSIIPKIAELAADAISKGYILRSGGADGADTFWEREYIRLGGQIEIFLPWKGFNSNKSELYTIPDEAYVLASKIHPVWDLCNAAAKKLHARNILQVLGKDLKTPSETVYVWTKNGENVGGTRTAIMLAIQRNIPVVNLWDKGDL